MNLVWLRKKKIHARPKLATLLAVKPSGRFGAVEIKNNLVNKFIEKPKLANTFLLKINNAFPINIFT